MDKRLISHEIYIMMQTKIAAQVSESYNHNSENSDQIAKEAKRMADAILEVNNTEVLPAINYTGRNGMPPK